MIPKSIEEQKKALRSEILKKRNSIAPPDLVAFSNRICSCVTTESKYVRCNDILLYSHFGSEVKTDYIFEHALKDGKNVYFPKVEGNIMNFYKVNSMDDLKTGFKGMLEPYNGLKHSNESSKAIIIVPGSVFGRDGYRIGYGRNFYDNFLSRFPDMYKIGICFSRQLVDTIPVDESDVQLDEIICEECILTRDGKGEARWI